MKDQLYAAVIRALSSDPVFADAELRCDQVAVTPYVSGDRTGEQVVFEVVVNASANVDGLASRAAATLNEDWDADLEDGFLAGLVPVSVNVAAGEARLRFEALILEA